MRRISFSGALVQRLNILKKRLERAEKLLAESDKSIGEIGEICGFGFYSEFALFFKKKTGLTPACYRNGYKND